MKPKKIVLVADGEKKFSSEVFELIRTKLAQAPEIGGNVNLGVKLAAEAFAPRMPATVMAAELEAAIPAIAAKFAVESARKPAGDGQLPLNDEAQKLWDSGRWRGQLTVRGLAEKYAAEIKDGVDLTLSMIDAYVAELVAEKAAIVALVDEKPDPDPAVAGKLVPCGAVRHRGNNEPAVMQQRFLLEKGSDGKLRRRQHGKGDGDFIVAGELLRADEKAFPGEVPPGVVKIEELAAGGRAVAFGVRYCAQCRSEALEDFRARKELPTDHPDWVEQRAVLTFYTVAGLRLVTKREAESAARIGQARNLEGAGARTFGGSYGTRKDKRNWHVTRGKR